MPESTFETIYGRCECASVRYAVDAPAKELYHCHCTRCRRLHGTLFATYAYVGRDHFRIEEGSENLSTYRSPLARWSFCRHCGCHLFAEHEEKPGVVWYMPATLEGESMPGHPAGTEKHIFVASKSPIDRISDALPQYDSYAPPEVSATSPRDPGRGAPCANQTSTFETAAGGVTVLEEQTCKTRQLVAAGQRRYVPNYVIKESVLDRGRGARIWDLDDNEYIDFSSGIGVMSLGHGEPELAEALSAQANRLWHASNHYFVEPVVRLAEELCEASFTERVFFCNSGAEANEAAIKLARKHSSLHYGAEKREIVTFHGGFHGRTLGTVTATAQPKYREGFEPLPGGFRYCDYNDTGALDEAIGERTCAVLVEPIQGEGGVIPAKGRFLAAIAERCRAHDALLIIDEVQSGLARTGRLFAYEWVDDLVPDVVTIAKALGGGLPLGAMLVGAKAAESLPPGSHGSTFGGNPIAAAVAREVLRKLRSDDLLANVERQGKRLRKRLVALHNETGFIAEVRGKGLMIGAVLRAEWVGRAEELGEVCRRHGVLVLQAGSNVLRFLPPLNISDAELDEGMDRFEAAMWEAVGAERETGTHAAG